MQSIYDDDELLFNHIVSKVIEQGEPAVNSHGLCEYSIDKDGKTLRCAAGWAVKDEHLPLMPVCKSIYAALSSVPEVEAYLGTTFKRRGMLQQLQRAHDSAAFDARQYNAEGDEVSMDRPYFLAEFTRKARAYQRMEHPTWRWKHGDVPAA